MGYNEFVTELVTSYILMKINEMKGSDTLYTAAKAEMNEYYRKIDMKSFLQFENEEITQRMRAAFDRVSCEMNEYYQNNKELPTALLKSKLHRLIAENYEPVLFLNNPFFFEISSNNSQAKGVHRHLPASILTHIMDDELTENIPEYAETKERFGIYFNRRTNNLCSHFEPFDRDHNALGYAELLKLGVRGLSIKALECREGFEKDSEEYAFLTAVCESCETVIHIAHKFSDKARELLAVCRNDSQRANMQLIADTARRIPEYPPETFYEGLAMILFMREITSALEYINISQLGHMDLLLWDLYRKDTEAGRITRDEAKEFILFWMMHTDVRFNMAHNEWPETSTCIQLGGCDADGNTVYNELTELFIEVHTENKLVNPKLNCRYSSKSPDEYLKLIGCSLLGGHNTFALFNDDMIIEGLMKNGVSERDARTYISGGCQETMLGGLGHTEGTAMYYSVLRIFDVFMRGDEKAPLISPIDKADSFDEFYEKFIAAFKDFFDIIADQRNFRHTFYKNALSCPLFSATQEGCLASGKDYASGGSKYNISTTALVGLVDTADSLYAVKTLVFDKKLITLDGLKNALAQNWEGFEELRHEAINAPKYGHGEAEADLFIKRFFSDVSEIVTSKENDRGGFYIPSVFVYYFNREFARGLRATPDGRRDFDNMAAGCAPSGLRAVKSLTDTLNSVKTADLSVFRGGAVVLDMMLPISSGFNETLFTSFMRGCNESKATIIQPNAVTLAELLDAKAHPENHRDLIVRICGLSAYFVSLTPAVQDELISRHFYER